MPVLCEIWSGKTAPVTQLTGCLATHHSAVEGHLLKMETLRRKRKLFSPNMPSSDSPVSLQKAQTPQKVSLQAALQESLKGTGHHLSKYKG